MEVGSVIWVYRELINFKKTANEAGFYIHKTKNN
jgi:hypothetical protein